MTLDPGQPVGAGGTSLAAYAMISFAVYGAMLASTAAGGAVALERAQGWSRQLRITPLTPAANIAVKILGGLVLGLLAVLATFAAGAATGVRMPWQVWVLAGLAAWLGSLVFTALGLLVGYLVPSENVMQFMGPVLAFLAFFGGIFMPLSQLPELLQAVGVWTPTYGIGEIAAGPAVRRSVQLARGRECAAVAGPLRHRRRAGLPARHQTRLAPGGARRS